MQIEALKVEGLSKRFGKMTVVNDVRLSVPAGERRAVIGPNGAGKTTLFNLISGDLKASAGHVNMWEEDVSKWSPARRARRGLRRTYQSSAVFDTLTVEQNIAMGIIGPKGEAWNGISRWSSGQESRDQIERVLDSMRLTEVRDTAGASLSHGERRQLELGMAIASNSKILLLDEPAAGLSEEERLTLMNLLDELEKNITILMIEHDMRIALGFADYVSVLDNGTLIAEGTPSEISKNETVRAVYLGEDPNE